MHQYGVYGASRRRAKNCHPIWWRVKRLLPDLLTGVLHNFRLTKTLGNNSPHKKNSSPHVTTHEPIMRMSHESTLQKKRKEKKSQNPIHQYDVKMPLADVSVCIFCGTRCLLSHCLFLRNSSKALHWHSTTQQLLEDRVFAQPTV